MKNSNGFCVAPGVIAFEAIQELNYADDTTQEKPITFRQIVEETAIRVIAKLP